MPFMVYNNETNYNHTKFLEGCEQSITTERKEQGEDENPIRRMG